MLEGSGIAGYQRLKPNSLGKVARVGGEGHEAGQADGATARQVGMTATGVRTP